MKKIIRGHSHDPEFVEEITETLEKMFERTNKYEEVNVIIEVVRDEE